jgi:hypothetical protein
MNRFVGFALSSGLALSACSVREARIHLSPALVGSTQRLELTGMGAGQRGSFRLAEGPGTFTRSANRLGIFDPLLVKHRGGGQFHLKGMGSAPDLAGSCSYREGIVSVGPVSIKPGRLVFHCDFARGGRSNGASLVIIDPAPTWGTLHGRNERTGMIVYEGREIAVRSIHKDAGGGLPSPTALGYSFSASGREIGAVDLNGLNKTFYVPFEGLDREAVIAASIALSTFWDPALVQD